MVWFGMEISVWTMEDARIEWKTIFHTNFVHVILLKNIQIYVSYVVINNNLTEVFNI